MVSIIVLLPWNRGGRSIQLWMSACVFVDPHVRTTRFAHFHWCCGTLTKRLVVYWGFRSVMSPAAVIRSLLYLIHTSGTLLPMHFIAQANVDMLSCVSHAGDGNASPAHLGDLVIQYYINIWVISGYHIDFQVGRSNNLLYQQHATP